MGNSQTAAYHAGSRGRDLGRRAHDRGGNVRKLLIMFGPF